MTEERRKKVIQPQPEDLNRKRLQELRSQEKQLQGIVHGDKPVVDGQINFQAYEQALEEIRSVRAQMATLEMALWVH